MRIILNSKEYQVEKECATITDLLEQRNIKQIDMISISINGLFVSKNNYKTSSLKTNDEVRIINLLSGG